MLSLEGRPWFRNWTPSKLSISSTVFQSCKPQGQALALGGLKASIEGLGLGLGLVGLSLGLGLAAQALALNDFHDFIHILLSLLLYQNNFC